MQDKSLKKNVEWVTEEIIEGNEMLNEEIFTIGKFKIIFY